MDEYYDMLRKYVKTSLVVVYGQSWCPHCRAARKTLGKRGVYVEMTSFESGISKEHKRILKDLLERDNGIPIVFVGQKLIENKDLETLLGVSRKRRAQQHNHESQPKNEEIVQDLEDTKKDAKHVKKQKHARLPSLADQLRAAAKF